MITLNILCVLLAVPALAYLGTSFLRRRDRTDRSLGLALCLSSLFGIFYGGASLLEEERDVFPFFTRLLLGGVTVVAWCVSLVYAVKNPGTSVTVKAVTVGLVILFTIWMASLDARLDSRDLPLLVGLAAWLTAVSVKPRVRHRARLRTEDRGPGEGTWKKSA